MCVCASRCFLLASSFFVVRSFLVEARRSVCSESDSVTTLLACDRRSSTFNKQSNRHDSPKSQQSQECRWSYYARMKPINDFAVCLAGKARTVKSSEESDLEGYILCYGQGKTGRSINGWRGGAKMRREISQLGKSAGRKETVKLYIHPNRKAATCTPYTPLPRIGSPRFTDKRTSRQMYLLLAGLG